MASNAENVSIWWRHHGEYAVAELTLGSEQNIRCFVEYISYVFSWNQITDNRSEWTHFHILMLAYWPPTHIGVCYLFFSGRFYELFFLLPLLINVPPTHQPPLSDPKFKGGLIEPPFQLMYGSVATSIKGDKILILDEPEQPIRLPCLHVSTNFNKGIKIH